MEADDRRLMLACVISGILFSILGLGSFSILWLVNWRPWRIYRQRFKIWLSLSLTIIDLINQLNAVWWFCCSNRLCVVLNCVMGLQNGNSLALAFICSKFITHEIFCYKSLEIWILLSFGKHKCNYLSNFRSSIMKNLMMSI